MDAQALREAFLIPRPWLLIAVLLLNFVLMGLRTLLWAGLLRPLRPLPLSTLFDLLHVGYMANNLLPLKAGEFFRASFVAKKWQLPYAQVLTTVGLERYFSGIGLVLIFGVVAAFLDIPLWIKTGVFILAAILIAVQVTLVLLWKRKPDLDKWERRHPVLRRIIEFFYHVGEGSEALRSFSPFIKLVGWSLATWIVQGAMLQILEIAFGIELTWMQTVFVMMAINLAIALPSAPASIGTFEYAAVLAYQYLDVDKAPALGIAFYFHFLQVIPVTLVGLFYYFRWGIRLKDLEQAVEVKSEAIP